MKISKRMVADRLDGNTYRDIERPANVRDVAEAIRRLDGKTHTTLTIAGDCGILTIGGGPERFYVMLTTSDDRAIHAVSLEAGQGTADIYIGGQCSELPEYLLVTRSQAQSAAESFMLAGAPSSLLNWEPV